MSDALLAFLAAVAGAAAALWTAERNHRLANVTAERAAWRVRMRDLGTDLIVGPEENGAAGPSVSRRRAAAAIRLSTNPFDPLDREIVDLADRVATADEPDPTDVRVLALRLQLLLKHDWERAKAEVSWAGALLSSVRRVLGLGDRPATPNYRAFVDWRQRNGIPLDMRLPPP